MLLILATAISVLFKSEVKAQDLSAALLLTKSEQYDKSDAMLQEILKKEPSNAKAYFFLGENALLNYFADTISNSLAIATKTAGDLFKKGTEVNPGDPLNYVGLAKVASLLGDDKTAADMRTKARSLLLPFKNIKKIVPPAKEYSFALAKIAESYIRFDEVDTASSLPLIREAVKIDNKNKETFLIAGDIYILATDGSNAIKNYNLAQFADPTSPTANMKIGNIYVRGKSLQAAIPYFEEAISLDANYAPAYRELGQLYWRAGRLEQSKENYKKYLELTEGNIPAKTYYVNSLFYAGDYDEVISNVEEILAVDKSRAYLNRLAGYSSFDKKNADYQMAQKYMEELFRSVSPDRINPKDYQYMARIMMKKNQGYTKMNDELNSLKQQLERETKRLASAPAAEKPKIKPVVDDLTAKVAKQEAVVNTANQEIERGFGEYNKLLAQKPNDRLVLNEIATAAYGFRKYDRAAKAWAMMIDPKNEKPEDYMQIGRAYYNAESLNSADSVFNVVITKNPGYVPAHLWSARTYYKKDPDYKLGLAKPKFEKLLEVAKSDSLKNETEMVEAIQYLGYYHMAKDDYSTALKYYERLINLNPNSKDNKIKGYNGIGLVQLRLAGIEKSNEGRLPYLAKSSEAYNKILALEPANASAKTQLAYIADFKKAVEGGINPNEIKGVVKDAATGAPIAYVSIRVKNTAAETITNSRGEYKFEIPTSSEILLVSAEGYQTQEIPVTKSRLYNVSLAK